MDAETLMALQESIAKWDGYATADDLATVVLGSESCPLCARFLQISAGLCIGCPVAKKTGEDGCHSTPFYDAVDAKFDRDIPAFRNVAREEANFLRSLLPPEASNTKEPA